MLFHMKQKRRISQPQWFHLAFDHLWMFHDVRRPILRRIRILPEKVLNPLNQSKSHLEHLLRMHLDTYLNHVEFRIIRVRLRVYPILMAMLIGKMMINHDQPVFCWLPIVWQGLLVGGLERGFYDFPFSWECHHPNWRTPSFFRGVGQPPTSFDEDFKPHNSFCDNQSWQWKIHGTSGWLSH